MEPGDYNSHPIKSIEVALNCLKGLGYNPAECLSETGISESMIQDANADVSLAQERAFYRNVAGLTDTPIGLEIGAAYRVENYGIWGLAIMSAGSVREAIQIALQFQALTYTFFHYAFEVGSDGGTITLQPFADFGSSQQLLADRDMAATALILNQIMGRPLVLRGVSVRHGISDHFETYNDYYGCGIEWDSNRYSIRIARTDLDRQPAQHNPDTAKFCAQQCARLIAENQSRMTMKMRVRHRLSLYQGDFPEVGDLATDLGVSYRSLRRLLKEETTSYQ